jgi:hypothetical protein
MADNEPTKAELEQWAQGLKNSWLHCRTYGCSRDPYRIYNVQLEGQRRTVWEVHLRCKNRCGNFWVGLIDPQTGDEITRFRKHYVKGYLAKGIGRIYGDKKAILRLEDIKRRFQNIQDKESDD